MMSILPLVWLHRRKKMRPAEKGVEDLVGEEIRIIPLVNSILRAILAVEGFFVSRGVRLPFGTSLLAVATKG
jgi:hypothetical protein